MMNKLAAGDYVPDGFGGFVRLEGEQAILGQALFCLQARRGQFPFLPQLGSRLHDIGREKPSARQMTARQYCMEALQELDAEVSDVCLKTDDDGTERLMVTIKAGGQIEVTI